MNEPVAKAKWVLETKDIRGIPAESLEAIAKSEDIAFLYRSLPGEPELGGQLLYKGKRAGIIVNTFIDNKGRQNFTFAHELGHFFLRHTPSYTQDGQEGFWCTNDDIGEGRRPIEVEANRFAVELLMPEEQFWLAMAGAPLDFALVGRLANEFMVSKHASSNRILDFTREPCIIVRTRGSKVDGWKESRAARGFLRRSNAIPDDTEAVRAITSKQNQKKFEECDASKWLCRSVPNQKVYECTHGDFKSGFAMTILRW